ncbi:MAG: hypothetical protein KA715_11365 [Xanthomonadaceae bacterium]|nr:hypothetical protein [Xanthomonadaceae bacterium]
MSSVSSADAYNAHLQSRIREVEDNAQEVQENMRKNEAARVEKMEKDFTAQLENMRDHYEKNAVHQRDRTDEAHQDLVKHYQNETDRIKRNMYDRYGHSQMNRMFEVEEKARRSIDQLTNSNETQLHEMEKYYDSQAKKALFDSEERKERAIGNLLISHNKELNEASKQRKLLEIEVAKERASINEGKVASVREYDQGWREKFNLLQTQQDIQQQHNKQQTLQARHHLENIADRTVREKDVTYNGIIAGINHDHKEELKYNENAYNQNIKRLEKANELDKQHDLEGRAQQAERLKGQYADSVENQTQSFNRTFKDHKAFTDNEIQTVKAENNRLKTSHDPKDISPAAEEKLRRKITGEYQKNADSVEARNKEEYEQLRSEYHNRWLEKDFEKQMTEQRLKRENISALQSHRQDTINTVRDMEERTRSVIVDESGRMNKREHANLKKHATEMEMQRAQIEGQVSETLDQAQLEKKAVRGEAEYKYRLKERQFSAKYNDMIKTYERQIAEIKDEHEAALRDQKLVSGKEMRDQERQIKALLEDIERSHKFEMATAEQTRKERERLLEETYQNELSKIRRTNQMLMKKRS